MDSNVVGLTGGIGSGKSTVAALFADLGVAVVDTDVISHTLTAAGGGAMSAIRAAFGASVCLPDGALDRVAMRERIFADKTAKRRLEEILHPLVLEHSRQMLLCADGPYSLLVVPLLFEAKHFLSLVQRSLVVDCDESVQLARVMRRDGMTESQAKAIIAAQCSRQARLARADDVIINNGDVSELSDQVARQHAEYLARF